MKHFDTTFMLCQWNKSSCQGTSFHTPTLPTTVSFHPSNLLLCPLLWTSSVQACGIDAFRSRYTRSHLGRQARWIVGCENNYCAGNAWCAKQDDSGFRDALMEIYSMVKTSHTPIVRVRASITPRESTYYY